MSGEIASEGAGRLHPRTLRTIEIEWQANDEPAHAFFADDRGDGLGIGGEFGAPQRLIRRGDCARDIRQGQAHGLGADIEAEQARARL